MGSMSPCHGGETGAMLQVKWILHVCSDYQMCFTQDEVINGFPSDFFIHGSVFLCNLDVGIVV